MISSKLSLNNQPKRLLVGFLSLLATHLILYTTLRFFFYFWNFKQFKSLSGFELLSVFVTGIRFDLAVAGPICALVMIIALWMSSKGKYVLILPLLFLQFALMMISLVDSELANYVGRRFTMNSLYMLGEGGMQSILAYYPLIIFGFFVMLAYFYFSIYLTRVNEKVVLRTKAVMTLVLLVVVVIFGRGGLQEKPISFINSKIVDHPSAHQLVLNSAFTFVKSIGRDRLEKQVYFSETDMLKRLNRAETSEIGRPPPQDMNIVIIMMESLSSEYVKPRFTPFFDQLSQKGVLYSPAYANGRRSVEGLAAILVGVPSLMEESYINSEFSSEFMGLGSLLKTKDYHTSFFHGAQNGSMRFDAFTQAAGFDHYFGKKEFNDVSQDDGAWGIYDKPFLKWTCEKLTTFPEKFASVIFTLTAHVPYHLPAGYVVPEDLKNEPPMIKSIHYADEALKNFFACAQEKPWFKNTLFVLLGDHTGPSLKQDASFKSLFEIPILFFAQDPARLQGLDVNQPAQQIDLLPTLLDFAGVQMTQQNHLARSLYVPGPKTIALFSDHKYELVGTGNLSNDTLKAFQQYFSQGLYENRIYR